MIIPIKGLSTNETADHVTSLGIMNHLDGVRAFQEDPI